MQNRSICPLVCLSTALCLALIAFSLTASSVTQATPLVINEYLADPPDGLPGDANGDGARDSTADEFIEIINASFAPLNIGGFTISDSAQVRFTIPAGKIIPPGEAAVVFGGGMPTGAFGNAAENGLVFSIGGAGLSLNNGGDTITIKDGANQVVASLTFGASEGNANQSVTRSPDVTGNFTTHSSAAGSQGSLFSPGARANHLPFTTTAPVIDLLLPDAVIVGDEPLSVIVKGSNFTADSEAQIDGVAVQTFFLSATELEAEIPPLFRSAPALRAVTVRNPGGALSNQALLTVLAAVGINEFLADPPDGPPGDANGDGARSSSDDEFIEIINRAASPADVGGFSIRDGDGLRFTFPPGTVIPANETAVIFGGGSPAGEFGNARANELLFTAPLSLNNTGDTITLIDREARAVEAVSYGAAEGSANQSMNRNPDSAGSRFAPHSTIAGSGGRLYSPGAQINGSPFTAAPRIIEIIPTSAPLGTPPFDATVRGSGFDPSSIAFIDSAPVATLFVSPAELIARVPGGVTSVAGQHHLHIRNEGGNRSNAVTLSIDPPPPILSAALPQVIISGTGAFTLFLLGENFEPGSQALVDDLPVATTFASRRELRAAISAALVSTPGSHNIRVRNRDGQLSEDRSFEVIMPASRITSIFPAQAIAGSPRFSITVAGSNFARGAVVSFGDALMDTAFISATELRAEVPASLIEMPGLRAVRVHNGSDAASNEAVFRVLPDAPVIHALEPESVIEGAGEVSIEIVGMKFRPGAAVLASKDGRMNSIRASFISESRAGAILPATLTQGVGKVLLRIENPDSGVSNDAPLRIIARDPLVINEFLADPPDGPPGDA
ncbi:MAG TPA: lamin tail domain-containing protein, partial [Blastocatellia bacterium]